MTKQLKTLTVSRLAQTEEAFWYIHANFAVGTKEVQNLLGTTPKKTIRLLSSCPLFAAVKMAEMKGTGFAQAVEKDTDEADRFVGLEYVWQLTCGEVDKATAEKALSAWIETL